MTVRLIERWEEFWVKNGPHDERRERAVFRDVEVPEAAEFHDSVLPPVAIRPDAIIDEHGVLFVKAPNQTIGWPPQYVMCTLYREWEGEVG